MNAVLRRATRVGRAGSPSPTRPIRIERLAIEWSHPRWLVERWVRELGTVEAAALLEANTRAPRVALRPNPRRTTRDALQASLAVAGVRTEPGTTAIGALVVQGGAGRLRDWANGLNEDRGEETTITWNNTLNYTKNFQKHTVKCDGRYEYITNESSSIGGSRQRFDYIRETFQYLNYGGLLDQNNGGSGSEWSLFSLFGSATYMYDTKLYSYSQFQGGCFFKVCTQ